MVKFTVSAIASLVLLAVAFAPASGSPKSLDAHRPNFVQINAYFGSNMCSDAGCDSCLDMMGAGGAGHSFQSGGAQTDPGTGTAHSNWRPDTCADDGHVGCDEMFDLFSATLQSPSPVMSEDRNSGVELHQE